jgi:hypothetical protein
MSAKEEWTLSICANTIMGKIVTVTKARKKLTIAKMG